jgi:hypothetical protein
MADIATGGPGDAGAAPIPAPAGAPAPAPTTRVSIGGAEYDVPAAIADSLRRERDRIAGEFGSRAQAYERRIAEIEAANEPDVQEHGPKAPDPRDLQYDPEKYHRENLAYTNALVANATATVEQRRLDERRAEAAEAQRNRNWASQVDKFYQDHPELRGDEDIVDTVWQRNFQELGRLTPAEGMAELAKRATARIVATAEKGKALQSKTVTLETSRGSRRQASTTVEENDNNPNVRGISDAIRAKQARFRMPFQKAS